MAAGALIRPARAADVAAVAAFQTASWREAYQGIVAPELLKRDDMPGRELRWQQRIVAGTRQVAVAERAGALLGVASWGPSDRAGLPPVELHTIYLAATEYGTGLADRLLGHALADRPAHLLVFDANLRARRFYARHGFRQEGPGSIDAGTGVAEHRMVRR